jgi:hypothetical protein
MSIKPGSKRFVSLCHHEAGHAVISHVLKIRISKITVIPNGNVLGQVTHRKTKLMDQLEFEYSSSLRNKCENQIMSCYAGNIAQSKHEGRDVKYGFGHDYQSIAIFLAKMSNREAVRNAYSRWLFERTKELVDAPLHWRAIEMLASELADKSMLNGKRAHELIDEILHPPQDRESERRLKDMVKRMMG